MILKILNWAGLAACVLLIIACFLPWAYYPVIHETFNGFNAKTFPNGTFYGRPGYMIVIMALAVIILMVIPRIWAKRTNLFLSGFLLAYVLSKFHIFTSSLFDGEVEKKAGVFLIAITSSVILLSSLFPNIKIRERS